MLAIVTIFHLLPVLMDEKMFACDFVFAHIKNNSWNLFRDNFLLVHEQKNTQAKNKCVTTHILYSTGVGPEMHEHSVELGRHLKQKHFLTETSH